MIQTSNFVTTGLRNFDFVGSIPQVMMEKVPLNNAINRSNWKLPLSGLREIPFNLKKIIKDGDLSNQGGKMKAKAVAIGVLTVSMKIKKIVKKTKSPLPMFEDDSEEQTYSDV